MKTVCRTEGATTYFVMAGLDPAYHEAARSLYYTPVRDGFAKGYPAGTPHLEQIYAQFACWAPEMVLQAARARPIPWDSALSAFLEAIEGQAIDWWLAGSAALAVRGLDVVPGDLDLIVDGASALKLGELLQDHLVEPVLPSSGWIGEWFGRAFLHARVEWVGDVHDDVDTPLASDFGPTAASRLEVVRWHGSAIRVPPLDLQLQVSERRGLAERTAKIRRMLEGR
jgi:hypothetical protein